MTTSMTSTNHCIVQIYGKLFFLFGQPCFPKMVMPLSNSPWKESVHVGHNVLNKVDNISLIVGNPQGILEQLLRPRPIHLLNIIVILIYDIKFYNIKLF
jgi:hypothetical protein